MTTTPPNEDLRAAVQGPPPPPRRLTRSREDRLIGGVAGGLGGHLSVDPLALRIAFVILTFAGGLGLVAYAVCLVFIPSDDPLAPPVRWGLARTVGAGLLAAAALAVLLPDWLWGPAVPVLTLAGVVAYLLLRVIRDDGAGHVGRLAARAALGILLLALAVGGFTGAAAGSALGGGIAIAGLVVACGVGLVGGAFRGGARWLIAPALVLALPLAAVAATDLDIRGSWGERTFRPATAADLSRGYEMGMGSMTVDLRDVELPEGRTVLDLGIGMGEIQVLVPEAMCVTTEAEVGMGAVETTRDAEQGGIDLEVRDSHRVAAGVPELHIAADIGLGALRVGDWIGPLRTDDGWRDRGSERVVGGISPAACAGPA